MTLDTDLLLQAYANGLFPMADSAGATPTYWVEPKIRAILPLDRLHISKSLRKLVRQNKYTVTSDAAFSQTMQLCAEMTKQREETWINNDIVDAFGKLHRLGHTHSVECWQDRQLVGGLYGLSIGRVFCGESMFSRADNASKVALVWLVARLVAGGFKMLDCQFMTEHLASLGAIELPQEDYLVILHEILNGDETAQSNSMFPNGDWGELDTLLNSLEDQQSAGSTVLQIIQNQ